MSKEWKYKWTWTAEEREKTRTRARVSNNGLPLFPSRCRFSSHTWHTGRHRQETHKYMHTYVCSPSYLFYSKIDGLTFVSYFFGRVVHTLRPFMFYMMCRLIEMICETQFHRYVFWPYSYCILENLVLILALILILISHILQIQLLGAVSTSTIVILGVFRFEEINFVCNLCKLWLESSLTSELTLKDEEI